MCFVGKAGENVKTGVGFEKGPPGCRNGSCEHGVLSGDKHLLGNTLRRLRWADQAWDRPKLHHNIQSYTFLFRSLKVIASVMWMIQKKWSMALVCVVLRQCVFLPNFILGSEHILMNMVKVCWGARGSPVLGTIYRPPTKCQVHTWDNKVLTVLETLKKWLSWTFGKEGGNPVDCSDSCLCFLGLKNHGEKSENVGGVMMMKSRIRKLQ